MSAPQVGLFKHLILELLAVRRDQRIPEPDLVMADASQAESFMIAGREDGVIAPTYLFHTLQLSRLIKPGDVVLDLACGPANQLAQVARVNPEAEFIGIDASESMLGLAADTVKRFALDNVRFESCYIQDLKPFADQSVDLVMSTMSLHHLPDEQTLAASFREAARVLKPDGAVYLADFSRLKREASRRFFAEQHAEQQSELFTTDYLNSLRAAFTAQDFKQAMQVFGAGVRFQATGLVPFMVVVSKGQPHRLTDSVLAHCNAIYASLQPPQQQDFLDLKRFFALGGLSTPDIPTSAATPNT